MNGDVKQVVLDKAGDLYLQVEVVDNSVADNHEEKFTFDSDQAKREVMMDLANKPYVLTEEIYHPDYTKLDPEHRLTDREWLNAYFQWQEKYAIGRIRKVFEAGKGVWNAWLHVTNSAAKEAYLEGKIPKKVSVGFFSPDYKMIDGVKRIVKGIGLHIAAVIDPAWKNAVVRSECIGNESCMREVHQAGIPNCGFCIKTVLNKLKPEQCFDSNSISQKQIIQASVMTGKLKLEDLKELTPEEKKALLKALSEQEPPERPESDSGPEEENEDEQAKLKKAKGAPIATPPPTAPVSGTAPTPPEQVDDKKTIAELQKQVADLLKKDADRDVATKKENLEVRKSMIESFTANEQDEELKKNIMERALALPTNEDVKFWLSLKYAQALEVTVPTTTRRGKVGHAGIKDYIDPRAVTRGKPPGDGEIHIASVFAFGDETVSG